MLRSSHPHPESEQRIRDYLEADAWQRHTRLATRLQQRRKPAQRKLRWQDRVLLTLAMLLALALLIRLETADAQVLDWATERADEWGLQLTSESGNYPGLLLDTVIHAEVTGLLARVHVVQKFQNPGEQFAEASYRFPLPDGAAVDRLFIKVGDRVLEGEIQERKEAERVYQAARDQGQTASLVQQERVNQFHTQLANIPPGEDIHVMIGFLVNVEFDQGKFSMRLPTTLHQRFTGGAQAALDVAAAPQPVLVSMAERTDQNLDLQINLVTDIGLSSVESSYHDVAITTVDNGYQVNLVNRHERTDRDFELTWRPDIQSHAQGSLMAWDDGEHVYAQLMLVPPDETSLLEQPREVIFVIDTSGSMEGASIQQARSALLRGLNQLGPEDRFNLVRFDSDSENLWSQSLPANPGNLQIARDTISRLVADGGTNMAPALDSALGFPEVPGLMRQVVFITDGAVGNEKELLAFVGDRLGASRLFTVSIGSAPNSWFMRKAAEIGRGDHVHIGQLDEVEERMASLWSRIETPAIQDLCIDWGMPAEYYPEVLPDLYAGQPLWVVARLDAVPSYVTLCGELNGQAWSIEALPALDLGEATLATLWARKKIESLQDSLVFGGDPEITRLMVTEVALEHGLLTPHTSLVAVDKTPVRHAGEALAQGSIPGLLPAGSTQHFTGFPATATGWISQMLLGLLSLLVSGAMFFRPMLRSSVALSLASRAQ